MIGIYDYTVILTYLSVFSAGMGIFVTLAGNGHPYWGVIFLLFSGLCDAFDGKVARTKQNRSRLECNFGIQIDSMSDVVAFGVLPACIGIALMRTSPMISKLTVGEDAPWYGLIIRAFCTAFLILYILAAAIRLAYFNVTEEERQARDKSIRVSYTGLPVTSAALIIPSLAILRFIFSPVCDITLFIIPLFLVTAFFFVSSISVPKPRLRGILIMVFAGAVEFAVMLLFKLVIYSNIRYF